MEERKEHGGLLLAAFLEVVAGLQLPLRGREGCGYWDRRTAAGERQAVLWFSPGMSSEKSPECISLQGTHCGRGGSNRFALVHQLWREENVPVPSLLREQRGHSNLDSEHIAPRQLPGPQCPMARPS